MDKNNPETIWMTSINPRHEPIFHQILRLVGQARSISVELKTERSGPFLRCMVRIFSFHRNLGRTAAWDQIWRGGCFSFTTYLGQILRLYWICGWLCHSRSIGGMANDIPYRLCVCYASVSLCTLHVLVTSQDLFYFTICVVLAAIVIFIFSRSSTNYRLILLCLYAFHPIVIRYWLFLLCFFLLPITYLEVVWP